MRASNDLYTISAAQTDGSSAAIPASQILSVSVQAVATTSGTLGGTLKLQFSNDPIQPVDGGASPTNWSDVTSATVSVNAAGVFAIQKTEICANWLRLNWAHGTTDGGTVTVRLQSLAL